MVRLTLREWSAIPIEAGGILPGMSIGAIRSTSILHGNRSVPVPELFDLTHSDGPDDLLVDGPTGCVKRIGEKLASGSIRVAGDVGMHAGAMMTGGRLVIGGNAGDWLGAEMAGGTIDVLGDAGHGAGAGYRGCRRGMTGGTIHIRGSAGDELGAHLRRGIIRVDRSVGRFAGVDLIAGTIAIGGDAGEGLGLGMKRGTIIVAGRFPSHPALIAAGQFAPAYLRLLAQSLGNGLVSADTAWHLHRGDRNTGGRGEIWCPHPPLSIDAQSSPDFFS
jgi:formylmethanofuran dehydrogenase subunit C